MSVCAFVIDKLPFCLTVHPQAHLSCYISFPNIYMLELRVVWDYKGGSMLALVWLLLYKSICYLSFPLKFEFLYSSLANAVFYYGRFRMLVLA